MTFSPRFLNPSSSKSDYPPYWQEACAFLAARDDRLKALIEAFPASALCRQHTPFITLAKAIVGQQISIQAANAIWQRLEKLTENSASALMNLSEERLRSVGLSTRKVVYLKSAAHYALEGGLEALCLLSEDEAKQRLLALPGIGPWTAEMFLIFSLLRPDIFPLSDLGLKKALVQHYSLQADLKCLLAHGESWRPYRTVATWYLWRSLDAVAVFY